MKRRRSTTTRRIRGHTLAHPEIHNGQRLSRRTIFYMKEYGPHSHVMTNIFRESIKILLLASVISSLGGVALESVRSLLILPALMVVPALNQLVGSFGTVVASKFTTALFEGHIRGKWWHLHFLHRLFLIVFGVAMISALYIATLTMIISFLSGVAMTWETFRKLLAITLITTLLLIGLIFNLSVVGGLWIYKRGEDPNNFLIPITTAVADFGALIIFAYLVRLLF